jgi:hypothetical protein
MALKYIVDTLDGMSPAVREHYSKADDGKFRLTLDGGHPDTGRLAEFRDTNIGLKKTVDDLTAKFDGIDPVAVKAVATKLAEYETAKPNDRIAALESQLAEANKRANGAVLKDTVLSRFFPAGGRASAADFILSKAEKLFAVEGGAVVGSVFDPDNPGTKLTVDRFIELQLREADFAFKPSSGSGSAPARGLAARANHSGVKELRNPTPQQLGAAGTAADIKAGKLKVVYDHD